MTFTLADLRKNRGSDFTAITKALEKTNEYGNNEDTDMFKLEKDKAGNGSAVIRFLPKHPEDALPWVQVYSHSFKGPSGRWYIENCRSTLNEADPVNDDNRQKWASNDEKQKEQARNQKRRLHYIANVYVVSYPAHPELEGTVMRYKFGKKIFEKIMDKAKPTFEDEAPLNVFDPFEGADFKLRMRQVDGYPNYDTSVFSDPKPIAEKEEDVLDILNKMKPLNEFIAPDKFKSYDELDKKFKSVMNPNVISTSSASEVAEKMRNEPSKEETSAGKVTIEKVGKTKPAPAVDVEDDDDIENYFKNIAQ
jgi:hypothetical protein